MIECKIYKDMMNGTIAFIAFVTSLNRLRIFSEIILHHSFTQWHLFLANPRSFFNLHIAKYGNLWC